MSAAVMQIRSNMLSLHDTAFEYFALLPAIRKNNHFSHFLPDDITRLPVNRTKLEKLLSGAGKCMIEFVSAKYVRC